MQIDVLQNLRTEISQCHYCKMRETCKAPVPFAGNLSSKIMFIGRDPGEDEDDTGFPFVGTSGQLLEETCFKVGFNIWEEAIISNTMKCRPPQNKEVSSDFYKNCCKQWLEEEIKIIKPKVIVILGQRALSTLLPGMTMKNGETIDVGGVVYSFLYHPSFWCRNGRMPYSEMNIQPFLQRWLQVWKEKGILVRINPDNIRKPIKRKEIFKT